MNDSQVLKELEKEIKRNLSPLEKAERSRAGYILNNTGQVTSLNLYDCRIYNNIKIFTLIKQLPGLSQLLLGSNQIFDLSPIKDLTNLTQLYLTSNLIVDLASLKELRNLTELYLSSNRIHDLAPLRELANLTILYLDSNEISDLSPLKGLNKLSTLSLMDNNLSDLFPLKDLANISQLMGNSNKFSDLSALEKLHNLTLLSLDSNLISDISPLRELTNLFKLSLKINQIIDLNPLKHLVNLTELYLASNQINDLSDLQHLQKLSILELQSNPIKKLPAWITRFDMEVEWKDYNIMETMGYNLMERMGYNLIEGKDYSINMRKEYNLGNCISFFDNPLNSPPPEIVKQGKNAIQNYFEQLQEQEEDYLFEAKLLILGEPGAGKTSLATKLENVENTLPREEDTTRGIDIKQYYFPLQKEDFPSFPNPEKLDNRRFRLNIWDFGTQHIYKATHRFFLSRRSLYTLVADTRNEDTDFNYWLYMIELFGSESPLLIILNEKHQRKHNIDIRAIQHRFTNISAVIDVDFAEEDKTRFNKLKKAIRYYSSQLPHVGTPVPSKWTAVREAIDQDNRNTITLQDYIGICKDNGIFKSQDALVLSQYFHDIGVFLHFQEDDLLDKTIILKPNWATNAAYKLLDHGLLSLKNGRFNKEDAKTIWDKDEFVFVRNELLRLMQKFFLTFEIERSGEYIVPERLQPEQPAYEWEDKNNLFLRYEYDLFMPKGIMSQFIVQMNNYIGNYNLVWRRGVVLERENTSAEIIETYDARTINIKVAGKNRRDFMTILNDQLDKINTQFEKLKVEKLIPCICSECKLSHQPHFFKYKDLKRRLEKGRQKVECERSFEMVNVKELIDEIFNEDMDRVTHKISRSNLNNKTTTLKRDTIFVSYSHGDTEILERVQRHLKVLEREGISVNLWDDTQIKSGMKWKNEIEKALLTSKVAVLLISTDFLASKFITEWELPVLLKAAESEGTTILALILKPCRFSTQKDLSAFQTVNNPSTPLSGLSEHEQEKELLKLTDRVAELIKEYNS